MTPQEKLWLDAVAGNPEKLRRKMRTHCVLIAVLAILTGAWILLLAVWGWRDGWSVAAGVFVTIQLVSNILVLWNTARLLKSAQEPAREQA